MSERLQLNKSEREDPLWLKIEAHLKEWLDTARRKNDGALDPIQTANLRGEIKTLKRVLSLSEEDKLQPD